MDNMSGLNWGEKNPEMVTIKEASRLTEFSYDFLRRECLKGNLVHIRIGTGKFLINYDVLVEQMRTARGSFKTMKQMERS